MFHDAPRKNQSVPFLSPHPQHTGVPMTTSTPRSSQGVFACSSFLLVPEVLEGSASLSFVFVPLGLSPGLGRVESLPHYKAMDLIPCYYLSSLPQCLPALAQSQLFTLKRSVYPPQATGHPRPAKMWREFQSETGARALSVTVGER